MGDRNVARRTKDIAVCRDSSIVVVEAAAGSAAWAQPLRARERPSISASAGINTFCIEETPEKILLMGIVISDNLRFMPEFENDCSCSFFRQRRDHQNKTGSLPLSTFNFSPLPAILFFCCFINIYDIL